MLSTIFRLLNYILLLCFAEIAIAADNKCDIRNYIFQDQKGNEASVNDIKECFGYFNKDHPSRSSSENLCLTEMEVNKHISKLGGNADIRIVGSRIFTIIYLNKRYDIIETAVVGSPWLFYEVADDLNIPNINKFRNPGKLYNLLDGDPKFDFSADSTSENDDLKKLYKNLFGKTFIFKRCQV